MGCLHANETVHIHLLKKTRQVAQTKLLERSLNLLAMFSLMDFLHKQIIALQTVNFLTNRKWPKLYTSIKSEALWIVEVIDLLGIPSKLLQSLVWHKPDFFL